MRRIRKKRKEVDHASQGNERYYESTNFLEQQLPVLGLRSSLINHLEHGGLLTASRHDRYAESEPIKVIQSRTDRSPEGICKVVRYERVLCPPRPELTDTAARPNHSSYDCKGF